MTLKIDSRHLLSFVAVWSILGYPLLSVLTTFLDLNVTAYSITMRGLVVFSGMLLIFNHRWVANRFALCLFLVFWLAYFFRVYVSQYILGHQTSFPPQHYWIWGLGVSFIPSLAVLVRFDADWPESLRPVLVYTALIATVLALLVGGTSHMAHSGELVDRSRWRLDSLNPISMGHLGASTFLLGLSMLRNGLRNRERLLVLLALTVGAALIVYANSRGPLLALAAAVGLMLASGIGRRRTWWILLGLVLFAAIAANIFSEAIFSTGGVLDRWISFATHNDPSTKLRFISFSGAWDQFTQNPIFGHALEEHTTQYYPHNVVLESLMATGLMGGAPFVALIVYATYAALKIMRRGKSYLWIGLLTVQYIVASQISGSIVMAGTMWVMIALATSYYGNLRYLKPI